ncbi:MAG: AAA family ATPase, partial [Polaromonas sp.]|nr:AAA family ATPase [Polaromonas sp.]
MSVLYLDHFSLAADPFRITPDTEFFFTGGQRGDILEGLIVAAMHDEGIVSVVGEIGMGKTMLSRMLLERLRPLPCDTVYLANPVFDRDEILGAIAHDLMAEPPQGNRAHMLAALEAVLIERYSQGRRVVVVIDEAHSMPATTLEEIRLLSNLETTQNKLLKIVLFGQPELDELLDAPQLRQVKDRISHRFELQPLNADEASAYLRFRLHKAGWQGGELFDTEALKLLVQASGGRTRRLNMLADKSLLAAYAEGVSQVGAEQVSRAVGDSLPKTGRNAPGMGGRL